MNIWRCFEHCEEKCHSICCCPPGPPGQQGETGPIGPSGPRGPRGPSGPSGPRGATGATGEIGSSGASGAIGATGPSGATGATGATGPSGASGAIGATGPSGASGAIGATGPSGASGTIGATGPSGASGAIGATGPSGAKGATGASGPSGASGATGATGPQGEAGTGVGCACTAQMKNIIQQIITTYPITNITVNLESGGNVSGRPNSITYNAIFNLANPSGTITNRINICRIAYTTLTGDANFTGFSFLDPPEPLPTGCEAECEAGVRATLQSFVGTGTKVMVSAGNVSTGNSTVTSTAFGIAILNNNIAVSTCLVENIK